jgi:hypothetical protein
MPVVPGRSNGAKGEDVAKVQSRSSPSIRYPSTGTNCGLHKASEAMRAGFEKIMATTA